MCISQCKSSQVSLVNIHLVNVNLACWTNFLDVWSLSYIDHCFDYYVSCHQVTDVSTDLRVGVFLFFEVQLFEVRFF